MDILSIIFMHYKAYVEQLAQIKTSYHALDALLISTLSLKIPITNSMAWSDLSSMCLMTCKIHLVLKG
jgi:hypothetical protein